MNALVPKRSAWLVAWFRRYARRYVGRHFHAVRVSRQGRAPLVPKGPLIFVVNHPSWWDPMIIAVLTELFPGRAAYGPIDARALEKYRFFARLGFFGVEQETMRGARTFLRTGQAILEQPGAALWVTAQGRFTDARKRPVTLMPGVEHLAGRVGQGTIVPVALEYTFWDESKPEALVRFGTPIRFGEPVAASLERTQDALMAEAMTRDDGLFATLVGGRAGVGGVYDVWRRVRARLKGESFSVEHGTFDRGRAHS
jgi:1-acyl-sn-glycerol-3-phosphate acyltransferase